jgi:hypothetical protein
MNLDKTFNLDSDAKQILQQGCRRFNLENPSFKWANCFWMGRGMKAINKHLPHKATVRDFFTLHTFSPYFYTLYIYSFINPNNQKDITLEVQELALRLCCNNGASADIMLALFGETLPEPYLTSARNLSTEENVEMYKTELARFCRTFAWEQVDEPATD